MKAWMITDGCETKFYRAETREDAIEEFGDAWTSVGRQRWLDGLGPAREIEMVYVCDHKHPELICVQCDSLRIDRAATREALKAPLFAEERK